MVDGFKKTEIGLYPNDWIEDKLENVITVLTDFTANGSFASLAQNVKYLDKPNYARLIRLTDIRADFKNDAIYISKDAYSFLSKSKLFGNELLLANVGAYAGYSFLYQDGLPFKGSLGPNMFLIKFNEKLFVSQYAYYSFTFDVILQQLLSKAASSAQPKLNKQNVRECLVCYPPTKAEQTAIATALNDADALITQLEKLIAKKKAMKQGAMQELLKPKEGWETKTLGEVSKFRRGSFPQPYGLDKWYDDNTGFPFIQVYDVDYNMKLKPDTKRHISEEAQKMSVFVDKGSILLTIQGSIGRIAMTQYDAYVDRTLLLFESYKIPFNKYFFMLLVYVLFEQEKQNAPGGTIKTITKQVLANFNISYPNIEEQNRIAEILSDMDIEILKLEDKLEKQKQLKQGMMQSLLTGKIRLI